MMPLKTLAALLALAATPATADLSAVNAVRAGQGLAPLAASPVLEGVARAHSEYMARTGRVGHAGAGGARLGPRIASSGYRACFAAENVAWGFADAAAAIAAWQGSGGHRRNMLDRRATQAGLAGRNGFWTLVLASPC